MLTGSATAILSGRTAIGRTRTTNAFCRQRCKVRHPSGAKRYLSRPIYANPVDNCCYVDRQCHSDGEWTVGYWDFYDGLCSQPAQYVDGIRVEGSDAFVYRVREALDLLKARAPTWHSYAVDGLNAIREVPESIGAHVFVGSKRFDLTPSMRSSIAAVGQPNRQSSGWPVSLCTKPAMCTEMKPAFHITEETNRFRGGSFLPASTDTSRGSDRSEKRFSEYLSGLINDFFGQGHQL